jgi:hypothetical protein
MIKNILWCANYLLWANGCLVAKRDRPETIVNTLKGTRKLHAMRSTGHDYKLETRKLSCYCLNCLEEIDQCQNIDYCHRWKTQTLKVLTDFPFFVGNKTAASTPG